MRRCCPRSPQSVSPECSSGVLASSGMCRCSGWWFPPIWPPAGVAVIPSPPACCGCGMRRGFLRLAGTWLLRVSHTQAAGEAWASLPADELKAGFPQEDLPLKCVVFSCDFFSFVGKRIEVVGFFSFILFQLNEGPLLDGSTSGFHSSPADSCSGFSSGLAGPDGFGLRAQRSTELSMG